MFLRNFHLKIIFYSQKITSSCFQDLVFTNCYFYYNNNLLLSYQINFIVLMNFMYLLLHKIRLIKIGLTRYLN